MVAGDKQQFDDLLAHFIQFLSIGFVQILHEPFGFSPSKLQSVGI
jgi:hypothetical protein